MFGFPRGEGDLQEGRTRLCVGVAVWQSEQVLHFFFPLVLGKKIVFLKSEKKNQTFRNVVCIRKILFLKQFVHKLHIT